MKLVLMRHSQAADGSPDHGRKLDPTGVQQSKDRGRELADISFDRALISDAVRTQETFALLGVKVADVSFHRDLYLADPDVVIDMVRALPEEAQTVLIVAHEPTVSQVAYVLGEGSELAGRVGNGVSPSTAIIFEFERWDGSGRITQVLS